MSHAIALVMATFAAAALGQTVWTVPIGQDLDTYIAQASPGDILLLGGSHPTFQLDKGLTIIGLGTDPIAGTYISGFSSIYVNVPTGQRATLMGFTLNVWSQTGQGTTGVLVYGGQVTIADVNSNSAFALAGETIVQRVHIASGGLAAGGVCAISDSTLIGRNFATTFTSVLAPSPGLGVGGPAARVVASRVTAIGGVGGSSTQPPVQNASSPGVVVTTGQLYLTDCTLIGGAAAGPLLPGGVALAGSGNVSIARTTLTEGVGATAVSSGYQQVAAMVSMHCPGPPTRGATFQATATAGDSMSLLGIVGGLDRTVNTLPPIVEPLFGVPSQLVALTLAMPAPGRPVPVALAVPNVPALFGTDVWLQAIQFAGAEIRASAVVGGAIR